MRTGRTPGTSLSLVSIVLTIFFLSGATGLVYQVVWARLLTRVFGGTSLAISTVLAAFMGGLALGSFLWGRRADRVGRPLVTYGKLELGVAVSVVLLPFGLKAMNEIYRSAYAAGLNSTASLNILRALASFLLLLIPTTFMGGTLPVLGRAVADRWETLGGRLGALYGINTLGAVAGTLVGGFYLIGRFGLRHTTWFAAGVNVAVALVAFALARHALSSAEPPPAGDRPAPHPTTRADGESGPSPLVAGGVLAAYAISGAAALALEVLWTRYLSMVLGTTVYAFSAMLSVFLLGLAAGSLVLGRVADGKKRLVLFLGLVEAGVGLASIITLYLFGKFPEFFIYSFHRWATGWGSLAAIDLGLAFAAMILPAFLLGGVFPLVTKIYARELSHLGHRVGTAYAVNTLGAIVGSLAGGALLLPLLGIRGASIACALTCVAVGISLVSLPDTNGRRRERALLVGGILLVTTLMLIFLPAWDVSLITRGVYVYPQAFPTREVLKERARQAEIVFYEEDPEGTVSVQKREGVLTLRINGKSDGSTGEDMVTQTLLAHLPLVLHPDPRNALVIGLGTGITLGGAEAFPLERITCAEISPAVIRAARLFEGVNARALDDARLTIIPNDARNLLSLDTRRYDCIISEPSNPWISGMGDLFTLEFMRLLRERLAPGGLVCQWIHFYQIPEEDLHAFLRTFQEVFPYTLLWSGNIGDLLLIGGTKEIPLNMYVVRDRLRIPEVRASLAAAGFTQPEALLGSFITDEQGILPLMSAGGKLVTDDNLLLEFSVPRNLFRDTLPAHARSFLKCMRGLLDPRGAANDSLSAALIEPSPVMRLLFQRELARRSGRTREGLEIAERAYAAAPHDPRCRQALALDLLSAGIVALRSQHSPETARAFLERARRIGPGYVRIKAEKELGHALFQMEKPDSAELVWQEVVEVDPRDVDLLSVLGAAQMAQEKVPEATRTLEQVVRLDPDHAASLQLLAYLYAREGKNMDQALDMARRASRLERSERSSLILGQVEYYSGDYEKAAERLIALTGKPEHASGAGLYLGKCYLALGRRGEARQILQQVLRRDPNGPYAAQAEEELRGMGGTSGGRD